MTLTAIPLSLARANDFIGQHHRHHEPLRFHTYSIDLLMAQLGVDAVDAAMLISVAVDARFSYMGGPPYRAKAAIARTVIGL